MKAKSFEIADLFSLTPGAFHATSELDIGATPLVSCGEENNGVIGYYDIPADVTHRRALTVAFNGFPLTTNFHPYTFGAKDDVAILQPLQPMTDGVLIYVAVLLNDMRWRYSYGRKCYREKLRKVRIELPMKDGVVDSAHADDLLRQAYRQVERSVHDSVAAIVPSLS